MKKLLIAFTIIILPFLSNAQSFNIAPPSIVNNQLQPNHPVEPKLQTVKPISRNHIERAQAKLANEERKLVNLARKESKKDTELRIKQKKLNSLEQSPQSNTSDAQKKIAKLKQEIAKDQEKLNKQKTEVDLRSQKVEALERALEEEKLTRADEY